MSAIVADAYAELIEGFPSRELVDRDGLAVALADAGGRVVLATETAPLANVEAVARTCLDYYGSLDPGDVVITNDPYSGGTRVQDHFVLAPVHDGGSLTGVAVVCAPFVDVGGMTLGNVVPEAGDLFTEGVRTRPIRVRRGGRTDEDIIRCLQLNSRVPVLIAADVAALSDLVAALSERAADVLAGGAADELLAPARALLAEALAGHGEGRAARALTDELALELSLSVRDGALAADVAGSSPQPAAGHLNATLATTTSAVVRALRDVAGCPLNSALTESARVQAPERSIVNSAYPAPVGGSVPRISKEVFEMTQECLSEALGGTP